MKTALVTGATGKIGHLLVAELLRQKYNVRVLVRRSSPCSNGCFNSSSNGYFNSSSESNIYSSSESNIYSSSESNIYSSSSSSYNICSNFPSGVEVFYGDITNYDSVCKAVSGISCVFHLAALLHINVPLPSMNGKYHDINVTGTWNVLKASLQAGVKRVVFFSTIAVYGPGRWGQIFFENSSLNPVTIYAKSKTEAENLACRMNMTCGNKPLITILRLASVYGTRVAGNYQRLIKSIRKGFFFIPDMSNQDLLDPDVSGFYAEKGVLRTLIHERDVVTGAIIAATHPEAAGKTYNLTDGTLHSFQDIVQCMADALSKDVLLLKVPAKSLQKIADILYHLSSCMPRLLGKPMGQIAHTLNKLMENSAVDGSKIQKELGFMPQYDLKQGWHQALNSFHVPYRQLSHLSPRQASHLSPHQASHLPSHRASHLSSHRASHLSSHRASHLSSHSASQSIPGERKHD